MQTLIAHSALWRGVSQFAGMLLIKVARKAQLNITAEGGSSELVSWCSGARSRREDELARSRQAPMCHIRSDALDAVLPGQCPLADEAATG